MSDQPHFNVRRRRGWPPQPSRSRSRWGILLAALLSLMFFVPMAGPANATPDGPVRDSPPTEVTDITISSTGEGRSVTGALPPLGTDWPITEYPTAIPSTYEREDVDFAGIINTQDVTGENTAQMYCIDLRTETRVGIGYTNGTWDESNVPNIGYVERILNTYYPATNAPENLDINGKAAAVQAAIWFFTDGFVVNPQHPLYSAVSSIVAATIADGPLPEPAVPNVTITPVSAEGPVNGVAGPYTVAAENAAEVTLIVDDGFSLYADAAGTVPLPETVPSGTQVWVRSDSGSTGPAELTARAAVTVPTGNVFLYDGNTPGTAAAQKLILADTQVLSANATASAEFFETGSLQVTKTIAGAAAGSQGDVVINIDCGPDYQFTFTVPAGSTGSLTSETFTDIPVDTVCTITEPTNGSSTSVSVLTDLPGPQTITSGDTVTATVTDTYTFTPGTLAVRKIVTGTAAGAQGEVQISVVCTSEGSTVLDTTVTIAAGETEPEASEFPGLAAGTECTVTESVNGETEAVSVTVTGEGTVTVPAGGSVEAAITDTYEFRPGTFAVRKDIAGDGAGRQSEVVLTVTCTSGLSDTITIPAGTTEPTTEEYENLPAGTSCTVTETTDGTNAEVSVTTVIDPAGGTITIPAGDGVEVTVTDTYTVNPGALTLNKVIAGASAGQQGQVEVLVTCTLNGATTLEQTVTIDAQATGTIATPIAGIPEGSTCAVTEPVTGETETIEVSVDLPTAVVIAAGATATATVTNTYTLRPGIFVATKVITGEAAGQQDTIQVRVICTSDGVTVLDEVFQAPAGATGQSSGRYTNIPAGASCDVTEPQTGETDSVLVETILPDPVTILAGETVESTLTNTYTFAPGTLTVTKTIDGAAALEHGEIVLLVQCGPDGSVLNETVTIAAGTVVPEPAVFDDLPADTECTVTEPTTGATETVQVSTVLPETVTIPAGDGTEATVTNTYTLAPGSLAVTKSIAGEAAGQQGEVVLQVLCGPDGSVLNETVTIPAGTQEDVSTTFEDLPAGTECAVSEPVSGATTEVSVATDLPDPVTVPAGGSVAATVTNTYSFTPGTLVVTKVITGDAAGAQGEVVLRVRCGPDGTILDETVSIPSGTTGNVSTGFEGLPTGTECTVTEPAGGGTSAVTVAAELPEPVVVPAGGGVEATVINTYSPVIAPTPKPTPAPTPAPVKPTRPDLPSTGANGTLGFLSAGAGLLLAGGLALAASRRRSNRAEDNGMDQQ
ncbi:thioester domain-containing protein [Arthrobacter sp. APC 3897]|uniref:thioester domain-containing protein n=1 Tax=Arthrobacter sp. APC 3897 TaxID=3035204 RepID=UPI0025B37878|nr:thioester domain-containing protein [Arthrobacter sp. APC 3897]MDN3481573.1 thioester domain-containing protein [Arthrobacter sp. APC 3897]